MSNVPKRMVERVLRMLARRVISVNHPDVIGVTGSTGKTTTVRACAAALTPARRVRSSSGNYNNEIGVPLSVLHEMSGGRSIARWAGIGLRGLQQAMRRNPLYPQVLVLELGADKPGDIAYLVEWLRPTVGVVTGASATHLSAFGSISAVAEEKCKLVEALPRDGLCVLAADEPVVYAMRQRTAARVLTYGFGPKADVMGGDVSYQSRTDDGAMATGMRGTIRFAHQTAALDLPYVIGGQAVYAALAAAAVGLGYGIDLADTVKRLRDFVPPPGRMRLIAGIKQTSVIDDSYNSSPLAAQAAVRVLTQLPCPRGRKFAVLGDMLELGAIAGRAHRELGGQVARLKLHTLVCVGELARDIARGAREAGMSEDRIFGFPAAAEAGRFLQDRVRSGDVLLVKGSQALRLERLVKELMAEPERAQELLVRQGLEWGSG